MKVFSLAMVTLLLAAVWTESWGKSFRSPYSSCCYKNMFIKKEINTSLINSYRETPPNCSRRAIIVELKKGKKFCVDPAEGWVQQYLQRKKLSNTST
ncbi:C-C motif chemokine 1 [Numida meleagris]|uniref:C-C motif chemokine 1 n=1 Tax=Numida meleagris TaxID=8996 RepID=UPI000B3E3FA6|nr:C-C motif chemokine 1 [Numida meleagris]